MCVIDNDPDGDGLQDLMLSSFSRHRWSVEYFWLAGERLYELFL